MAIHVGGRGPGHLARVSDLNPSGFFSYLPISATGSGSPGSVPLNYSSAIDAALVYNAAIANAGVYYVKPSTGSDSNAGTEVAPFATVAKAMRTATDSASRVVMLEDCVIPSFDLRSTDASQSTQQFKWLDANGYNVIIRDTVADLATQTWTQDGTYSNWWKTTISTSGSQALKRVVRTDTTDSEGYSTSLFKLTTAPSSNGTTPSFYWDSVGKVAWVNLGGSNVETNKSILKGLYVNSSAQSRILVSGASLGLSGVRLEGVQIVTVDASSRRPEVWMHDCVQLWSVDKGWSGSQSGWFVATDCVFHSSEFDHANAFTKSATGNGLVNTANCRFTYAGDVNVFAANHTLQGTSAHGGSDHAGFGNTYIGNNGQGVADTCTNSENDITWLFCCEVTGGNTTAANYEFGSSATSASRFVYLDTCTSTSAPAAGDLKISANATVFTRNTTFSNVVGGSVVPY